MNVHEKDRKSAPTAYERNTEPRAHENDAFVVSSPSSISELRPLVLKHGDAFGVFDSKGDALASPGGTQGVYYCDTRHLSHFSITLNDRRPVLLSSTLRDDNATLTCDLANPGKFYDNDRVVVSQDLIHIRRTRFLWKAGCFERLCVRNFDDQAHSLRLGIEFAADFADLFEVRGVAREKRGQVHEPEIRQGQATLSYTGLDNRRRLTTLRFDPAPETLSGNRAVFSLELEPKQARSIFVEIDCRRGESPLRPVRAYLTSLRDARRELLAKVSRAASIASSNDVFNESARRGITDLYMLMTELPEGPYPYAGIPWYSTVFGRDGLITAMMMLWVDPTVARGVLGHLAATQATEVDPASDAEPGKILHEARHGEMAILGEVPFRRYYGSVDSTPLFVMLAGEYLDRTDDVETCRRLWPNIEAALGWIETYGDRDGDGLVEYARRTVHGLANQGWKDSYDAIFHADGSLAKGPIALVEVQAYVFAAWRSAERILRRLGQPDRAAGYGAKAEALRNRFDALFFDAELGSYVLALDGDKKPCRVRASNAGHALFAGVALPERADPVAQALMGSSSFGGWGIRTVASGEARYNPMSYHNGSVWPHDNALIAAGFARYGRREDTARVFESLFSACTYVDLRRLPELFCGFSRQRSRGPTFYPVACSPQAWAAAAPLYLLQSCLGLTFEAEASRVVFRKPALPDFLNEITLTGLSLPAGKVDVMVSRANRGFVVNVLDRSPAIEVVTIN
jgi:glycogen debranching enzyme